MTDQPPASSAASTYRLQFHNGMDFDRAAGLAPYLARLGVTALYASPVFAAAPGSTHGYDVADHASFDASLGGREGFDRMSAALKAEGLDLVLDVVPNHMAAHPSNPWWRNVLEWGPASAFAWHFDIAWSAERLLLPVLGGPYHAALEAGDFIVAREGGELVIEASGMRLPLTPPSYALVIGDDPPGLARAFAAGRPDLAGELKARLAAHPEAADAAIAAVNSDRARLHRVHEAQIWRLAHWRMAREALTYRRFFEVTDLVGVRVERGAVFDDVHRLLFSLIDAGQVQGIRLDHIDGLADPAAYLRNLRARVGPNVPIWVEKILHEGERLPPEWPVEGSTGYDFIADVAALMTEPAGETALSAAYAAFQDDAGDPEALTAVTKRHILTHNLAAELDGLTEMALAIARRRLATRDFGRDTLRRAIIEMAKAIPVYRTYVDVSGPSPEDLRTIEGMAEAARGTREVENEEAIDFIAALLTLGVEAPLDQAQALAFATRFQQFTGPVTAKSVEDTIFYRYNRLIALNEVGGAPDLFGRPVAEVHAALAARPPTAMITTATHDTKRGEDARARIYAISLAPERWGAAAERWSRILRPFSENAPEEREVEWLFFQTLLGVWPAGMASDDAEGLASLRERIGAFLEKAMREAKARTSWTHVDEEYEAAVRRFSDAALDPDRGGAFLRDFAAETDQFLRAGEAISLAQTAIRLAAPGTPDTYQGAEAEDLSLVDPDNRRPPDFEGLAEMLEAVREGGVAAAETARGRKLALVSALLAERRRDPELFARGAYQPLDADPPEAAFGFARRLDGRALVVAAPIRRGVAAASGLGGDGRFEMSVSLGPVASIPNWRDVLTGERAEIECGTLRLEPGAWPIVLAGSA